MLGHRELRVRLMAVLLPAYLVVGGPRESDSAQQRCEGPTEYAEPSAPVPATSTKMLTAHSLRIDVGRFSEQT
jgi:hypothetical protein